MEGMSCSNRNESKKEKNVGMITFHASHNFGSVMQAWSLQNVVESFGYDCEIINYRMPAQKDKYSVFPLRCGWKTILRNLLQIRYLNKKKKCSDKYEEFIGKKLHVSEELNFLSQLENVADKYDIYLAGSDQIWAHGVPEFVNSKEDTRIPYFLGFTDKYKISYASSTGVSEYSNVCAYKEYLKKFSYLAVREQKGKEILQAMLNREVSVVLDPTYLVEHREWVGIAEQHKSKQKVNYILIYSLQGRKKRKKWNALIREVRKKTGMNVVTIAPFAPIGGRGVVNQMDAGPLEILNLFANASYVFTDTFHGMSFSIHFRKQFSLYEDTKADSRKENILKLFSLESRVTDTLVESLRLMDEKIDYDSRENLIEQEIMRSKDYLRMALDGNQ